MKDESNIQPPRWAQRLIEWYCRPELLEDLQGDLQEYFERNVRAKGRRRASLIYVIDAFKFFRLYTIKQPKFIQLLTQWIMIGSYLKSSSRNIARNKLFSTINIAGLAISMSVGLLMIAFLHDLLSFDKFQENKDRMYRVISWPSFNGEQSNKFASTSVKAGYLMREKATGLDKLTIITYGFGGDVRAGDVVVPISGLYAEPSFFDVFSFTMVEGNKATALKEPHSVVLTKTTSKKIFGDQSSLGKTLTLDSVTYNVTGVVEDPPFFSHFTFESLCSFSTHELNTKKNKEELSWTNMWQNYIYVLLPEGSGPENLQANLDLIADEQNADTKNGNTKIKLILQPRSEFVLGSDLSNALGVTMPSVVVWVIGGLSLIVILSACFNYTNLSIARSMRRFREVGLRKVIGAGSKQVVVQFVSEAVLVSLAALLLAMPLFLLLREQFVSMAPELAKMVRLEITWQMVAAFGVLSLVIGLIAGIVPAVFFSRVRILQALKDTSSVKVFRHLTMRKALVVVQYTFTIIFITTTVVGYKQYKSFLAFDLGFSTENVLNIRIQKSQMTEIKKALSEMPEVQGISSSSMITSVGTFWNDKVKTKDKSDSAYVSFNYVDENYIPLHHHQLIAGSNFKARPTTTKAESEVIVNEQLLKRFKIAGGEPIKAIGEEIFVGSDARLTIVGVMKDFHYGKVENELSPVMFRYWADPGNGFVNASIRTNNWPETLTKIEQAWKKIDNVHPLDAKLYDESIKDAYNEFAVMVKVIGFLSFLAISIASLGMFGMVVFTTETRLKEVSIRKVLGASSGNLVFLLGRGFLLLLAVSSFIAIPVTYFFFEEVVLTNFPYHLPITFIELIVGACAVMFIAFAMIGTQTIKAARTNPAEILKNE